MLAIPMLLVSFAVAAAPGALQTNLPDAGDEIPPLRPPRGEIPPTFWEQHGVLVIALAVLFLVVLALALWWLLRPRPAVPIPPAVQARQTLAPLADRPEDGPLLSRVSQVLQHYVLTAFGLPSGELTTAEFCQAIHGHEAIGPELADATGEFLRQCDEQKFAPAPPRPALGAVERALNLIDQAEARRAALAQAAAAAPPPPVPATPKDASS